MVKTLTDVRDHNFGLFGYNHQKNKSAAAIGHRALPRILKYGAPITSFFCMLGSPNAIFPGYRNLGHVPDHIRKPVRIPVEQ
jgi:hypothetical protein